MERNKLEELERNKKRKRELEYEVRILKARESQLRDEWPSCSRKWMRWEGGGGMDVLYRGRG